MTDQANYLDIRATTYTPIKAASEALGSLIEFYEERFPDSNFIDLFFEPMWKDEKTSGEIAISTLEEIETLQSWPEENPTTEVQPLTVETRSALIKIGVVIVSCSFVIQAFKAKKGSRLAWSYAIDANRWNGILQGLNGLGCLTDISAASKLGKLGADALHFENRAMKAEVFTWLDFNRQKFKSMDATAQAITREQPIAFRTARDWVGEWKKVRSTGTP